MGNGAAVYEYLVRWAHYAGGVMWLGSLFYLNFIQSEYLRVATPDARADNVRKLMPNLLLWFRYSSLLTLFTGCVVLAIRWGNAGLAGWNLYMSLGSLLGIILFINIWTVTIPCWQISLGRASGDSARASARLNLAARTNLLFSGPMLFFMGASSHLPSPSIVDVEVSTFVSLGFLVGLLELNGLVGRLGPLASPGGAAACSIALTFVMVLLSNTL